MKPFQKVRRRSHLPDQIAEEILRQISSGELAEGDNLPTEISLAEMFGVSRNVVREAIARLRSDGVIETRQGRGASVLPQSERTTFRVDPDRLTMGDNLGQLFELRGLLEIEAAGLAARRHSPPQLGTIKEALERMKACSDFSEEMIVADADFHRAVAAASNNSYLAGIIDYLSSRLQQTIRATGETYTSGDLLQITIGEHEAIWIPIKTGDPAAAQAAMKRHIEGAALRLKIDSL